MPGSIVGKSKPDLLPGSPDLRQIKHPTIGEWGAFRKMLRPNYPKAWGEIGLCIFMTVSGFATHLLVTATWGNVLGFELGIFFVLWIGFWLHALLNFGHEAAHYNLSSSHRRNDALADWTIYLFFPQTMTSSRPSCPVCTSVRARVFAQARDVEYYTSNNVFTYLGCDACGSVYLHDPPVDKLHEIYPSNYYSYQPRGKSTSPIEKLKEYLDTRLFRKLLRQIEGENLRVLDVGGGSGWLLTLLQKVSRRVKETHEVDIDESARSAAESAGHVFHCSRVEDFAFRRSFDLVLMLNLIEHVPDPAAVLHAMKNLLSGSGLILVKTPNVETLDCWLFRHYNWGGFHCPRHFVLFNMQSIKDLGRSCGLQVVQASYTQGAPQWASSILGWLGLKGWIRISPNHPIYAHPLFPFVCAVGGAFDFLRRPFMPTAQMFIVFRRGDQGIRGSVMNAVEEAPIASA